MSRRNRHKKGELEPLGGFVGVPYDVFNSKDYKGLSVEAKALLLEVIGQYRGDNNGDLTPSFYVVGAALKWGKPRHTKAVTELRATKLIQVTREGQRGSNGVNELWALSWFALNYHPKMDVLPKDYKRFWYRDLPPINPNAGQERKLKEFVTKTVKQHPLYNNS